MGSYCDSCYLFVGLSTDNDLIQVDNYDFCEKCHQELQVKIRDFKEAHIKYNTIGAK